MLACATLSEPARAQAPANPEINPEFQDQVAMLNEFSERRRVNVFFPNEQSVFHGVPVGFVSVGRGNFSFVRRDLVTAGRVPVIVARVYDSAFAGASDFSPGWRLSLAETIETQSDGSLRYVDESLNVLSFENSGTGFTLVPAQPSDILSLEASSDGYRLTLRQGWTKQFTTLGAVARLSELRDAHGNAVTLQYDAAHRLQRISGQNGHVVEITRDGQGRIIRIQDELGRQVEYAYGGNDQLTTVTDLGGNDWAHQYANTRLHKVLDPLGNEAVRVNYDTEGRAEQTRLYQDRHQYRYEGALTEVRDAAGNTSTFTQSPAGITNRVVNAQGFVSELELDEHHRVTELRHQGQWRARYHYDETGRLARVQRHDEAGEASYDYRFDAHGRLLELTGSDGSRTVFTWDAQGKLIERDEDGTITQYTYNAHGERIGEAVDGSLTQYTYNADGLLTGLQRGAEQARFEYDAAGRITAIAFPGGNTHEYRYDALGLRTRTTRSDGGHKYYRYDATGNLVRGGGEDHSGQYVSQALTLDDDNKVLEAEFANESTLQLEYDAQGNPTLLDWGNRTLACSYDPQGRLIRVDDSSGGLSEYQYAPGEPDIRRQWDTRVGPTHSEQRRESAAQQDLPSARYTRPAGTPWPGLAWNPALTQFDLPQEEGLVLPDALAQAAERRRHLMHTLASDPRMQAHFAMPSNSFFLPPEYVSVNCWLPGCWMSGGGLSVPATAFVGQPLSMTTSISAWGPDCWPFIYDWFVDGQYVTSGFNATSHSISHTPQSTGTHTVQTHSYCGCDMFALVRNKTYTASNPPPPPKVTILSANLTAGSDGEIRIKLEPNDLSGQLIVGLADPDYHTIIASPTPFSGGTYTFPFFINSLPNGEEYKFIVASWLVSSPPPAHSYAYHFKVIGDRTHTQYVSPSEIQCPATPLSPVYITTQNCGYSTQSLTATNVRKLREGFRFEVSENGSGHSINFGDIQAEDLCLGSTYNPPTDAIGVPNGSAALNNINTFRGNTTIKGSCQISVSNSTIAVPNPETGDMRCGDNIFMKDIGVKVVADTCPICGSTKIDHYNSSTQNACTAGAITNLVSGNRKAIKLF